MEAETTQRMSEYKESLDRAMKGVMPDRWKGHGRLAIRQSDVIPPEVEDKAIVKMNKLADKKGVKPERVANKLIESISEKKGN